MRAIILTADGVEDSELFYPNYRLLEEGWQVDIAAPAAGSVKGKVGLSLKANKAIEDVDAGQYDLLVLPGGKGPETVRLIPNALEVTRKMLEAGKVVMAICHGPQVLISAKVLKGRKATCYKGVKDDLIQAGAEFSDKEVVVDGNLVTSRTPEDLPAFCREGLALARKAK